ncbi:MAG: TonB-dependent receptor [Alistipes sp.]|nr:TonB-dependent receptor [Alistipes sp.]MBO7307884.1 TonB-dependent receptor [Alistipes sp.]
MRKFLTMCLGLALLAMAIPAQVFAQSKYEVKGVVVDTTGTPVIGASVVEQGTTNGVTTDVNGQYVLRVNSAESVVVISYIGYTTQTLVASSSVLQNVVLEEDSEMIDDVVVIGYGVVKKNDLTGSISTVKADQTNKGLATSPTDLLRGKSAGVVITTGDGAPGSASQIRIRGGSSLNASNDPLVVVDGLPISNSGVSGTANPLASINPSDIESFTVLKDASATAIYGSRASNGVIIITTKKGSKYDGSVPRVSVDFTTSLSQNAKYVDVMTGDEMRQTLEWYYGTQDTDAYRSATKYVDADGNYINTDWQREIYQLAKSYEGNISISGNVKLGEKDNLPYRVSYGYLNQDGTLKTSNMKRNTLSVNLNPQLLDNHLTINLNAKGMVMDTRFANTGAVSQAVQFDPTKPVYLSDEEGGINGYYTWRGVDGKHNTMANQNPVAMLNDKYDLSNAKRFVGNAQFDYKFHGFEDFRLNLNLGVDVSKSNGTVDVAPGAEQSRHATAEAGSGTHTNYSQLRRDQTLELYGAYAKTLGKHTFDVMLGYSWQWYYTQSFNETYRVADVAKWDVDSNEPYIALDPSSANYFISEPKTSKSEYFLVSFFGRANYSYDNRYSVTATLRADGTSRFANNKWGVFPSVALAWNAKNEDYLADNDNISTLKVRLSYGQTGQQDVGGLYDALPTYYHNTLGSYYPFGGYTDGAGLVHPIKPVGYNADLKWETTTTYNAGVDFGFADNRITMSADFYYRETKDLLNFTPVPAGANLTNYLNANIGDLKNIGFEYEINAVAVQTSDWYWNIGANVAWNKNTITRLTNDDEAEGYYGVDTGGYSGGVGGTCQVHQTGQPTYSFYVYQQIYDENGRPIEGLYVDRNGDGTVNEQDKYVYKKAAPDVTVGFNTQLSYKNLTLAVSAHANIGNYVYDNISSNGELLTDLWTNNFTNNRVVTAPVTNFRSSGQYLSDYYVRNASFLKLDNVTLSYRFNLCKAAQRDLSLDLFGTVSNVATLTGYKGIDPEIAGGIDNNMYPRPRTYILGLKFNF